MSISDQVRFLGYNYAAFNVILAVWIAVRSLGFFGTGYESDTILGLKFVLAVCWTGFSILLMIGKHQPYQQIYGLREGSQCLPFSLPVEYFRSSFGSTYKFRKDRKGLFHWNGFDYPSDPFYRNCYGRTVGNQIDKTIDPNSKRSIWSCDTQGNCLKLYD
ncbi:uncharacterized protein LOC129756591 isoform X1 [Uranotaenia lowii]|uniref:uncharacterized protein LOC129756591 isoform X1 n=1 Tax=Uranotaenia lowii TaxID=190385 RepID=UPI00247A3F3C|nr:uncharacterized protein LOC129756591 isoform X1 [Uranotaenia lowii]